MNSERQIDKSEIVVLRHFEKETVNGKIGLEMTLMLGARFHSYEPGAVISVHGLDYHPDDKSADCVCTEYFKPEELLLAMEAFEERLQTDIFRTSTKQETAFNPLDRILKKKERSET